MLTHGPHISPSPLSTGTSNVLVSTSSTGDSVVLSWTADDTVQNDLLMYEVHRNTQSFDPQPGDATKIDEVTSFTEGAGINYTDSNVTAGNTYFYEVIAVDVDGNTSGSNQPSITV